MNSAYLTCFLILYKIFYSGQIPNWHTHKTLFANQEKTEK